MLISMRSRAAETGSSKLSLLTKLSYGFGEMAEGVKSGALETFLFFYYIQVLGLSGSLTGLALLLALLIDGVTDPLIGNISDNLRSRLGRRHPFLYAAPLPLALFLYLLFAPPAGLGPHQLFAWLLVFGSLARIMQSVYFVPHTALSAELSTDFSERISVNGYRAAFSFIGRLAILGIAFGLFFVPTPTQPNGQLNPAAYPPFAIACGAVAAFAIFASVLGTHRRAIAVYRENVGNGALDGARFNIFVNLKLALGQRSFFIYFVVLLITFILGGVQAALGIHLQTFYWGISSSGIQYIFTAAVAGFVLGLPVAKPLARRFDKKTAYIACSILSVGIQALPLFLALLGIMKVEDETLLISILTVTTFVAGFVGGPAVPIAGAMLADIADEFELSHRRRAEGALFGAMAFARKASLGMGGAIAGVALDLIGINAQARPETISAAAKADLALLVGPAMFLVILASQAVMLLYPLNRSRHREILDEIEQLRGACAPVVQAGGLEEARSPVSPAQDAAARS